MNSIQIVKYTSPAGELLIGSYANHLCLCDWLIDGHRQKIDRHIKKHFNLPYEYKTNELIDSTIVELDEYFSMRRTYFDIPTMLKGTAFQLAVWNELTSIPYSQTTTYSEIARRINKPIATRAVANAIANNPISIIVPCHRVIGSNNKLTGYGGGLSKKKHLLQLEASNSKLFQCDFISI